MALDNLSSQFDLEHVKSDDDLDHLRRDSCSWCFWRKPDASLAPVRSDLGLFSAYRMVLVLPPEKIAPEVAAWLVMFADSGRREPVVAEARCVVRGQGAFEARIGRVRRANAALMASGFSFQRPELEGALKVLRGRP